MIMRIGRLLQVFVSFPQSCDIFEFTCTAGRVRFSIELIRIVQ